MDEYVVILSSGARVTIKAEDYFVDDKGVYFRDADGVMIALASHPVFVCFADALEDAA